MNDLGTPLTVISVELTEEHATMLGAQWRVAWGIEPVEIVRTGHPSVWLELYFDDATRAEIARTVVANHPLVMGYGVRAFAGRDWEAVWRAHFTPIDVGAHLRITPPWDAEAALPEGRIRLVIDPGMGFGTGSHFTTRFCLEMIEDLCEKSRLASCLDVGTGSGVLAIAASLLGVPEVVALDIDERALSEARRNARANGVEDAINFRLADIRHELGERGYDVVCANLYGQVLVDAAPILRRLAKTDLVLTGIRDAEAEHVAAAFLGLGAREQVRDGDGEWTGIHLTIPA